MKVLIDATTALGKTGVGTYGRNLIDAILDADSGVEFTLLFMGNVSQCPESWRRQAHVVGTDRPGVRKLVCGPGEHIRCIWPPAWPRDFDVYHSLELFLPKVCAGRSVLTLHGAPSLSCDGLSLKGRFAGHAVRVASRLVTVSRFVKDETVRWARRSPDDVHVVHHAVDQRAAKASCLSPRLPVASRYIAYVGGLFQRIRNLRGMVRAYAYLRKTYGIEETLVLAGQLETHFAEAFGALTQAASGEPLEHIGLLAPNDVYGFLRDASLLVYPSYIEGFGLPILEAMAVGCPVVTSTLGACPEVAGGAAVLVDPDDEGAMAEAMFRVIRDEGVRDELRRKGIERAREFTWERAARRTLEVYRQVAACKKDE